MRRFPLTAVLASLVCTGVGAQESPPLQPPRPIAESAERIARELWPIVLHGPLDEQGRPRFRTGVTVRAFVLPASWIDTEAHPLPFRPRGGSIYHHQYLTSVTPEAIRAGTLYPVGISVDPGAIYHDLKSAWRSRQEKRVRARIARELEELLARSESKH